MQRPRNSSSVFAKKLAAQALQGRSRLYHWLRANYAELAAAREQVRSTWADLAAIVVEAGLKDARGQDPSAEAVRKAWQKVARDVKASGRHDGRSRS